MPSEPYLESFNFLEKLTESERLLDEYSSRLHQLHTQAKAMDLQRQVNLDTFGSAANRVAKDGVFQGIRLYPILPSSQLKRITALFKIIDNHALGIVRAILAPYLAEARAVYKSRLRTLTRVLSRLRKRVQYLRRIFPSGE